MSATDVTTHDHTAPDGEASGGFELPPEVSRLTQLTNPILPWAIRVAATLKLPDLIAGGTVQLAELASRTGTQPEALSRMLRYLIGHGVFAQPEPGSYALTPLSELLTSDHPMSMQPWLDLSGAAARWDSTYVRMLDAVRTGEPVYRDIFGRTFWEDLEADPVLSASFDGLMAQLSSWTVQDVVAGYDWGARRHVVDIGGGSGLLLTSILGATPGLRGTLLDRPETAARARKAMVEAGLADRCEVAVGNFFEELPDQGDTYLICNVLHDWPDRDATTILRRCAAAAAPGGRVLVAEMLLSGSGDETWLAEMDLMALGALGGKKRTLAQLQTLVAAAGLAVRTSSRTPSGVSVVECEPASQD